MIHAAGDLPIVLVDCGQIRNLSSGLGQVACQYARALNNAAKGEFAPRFLTHPRFSEFGGHSGGAEWVSARLSLVGAIMRAFDKTRQRFVYRGKDHAVRHAIHPDCFHIRNDDRAPFVLTIHDVRMLSGGKRRKRWLKRLQQLANRASIVGFVSEYAMRTAAEHINFGDAEKRVINNGVNKPPQPCKPEWFSQTCGDRPFLFSVSLITESKNYAAMPPVMRRLPGMNLILAGRTTKHYPALIKQAARREGVDDRVFMPGEVSENEKAWLLQHCAGFVFPSLYEGFGMPVVEALHFGKPVFCFANTSLPEVGGGHVFYWRDDSPAAMAELIQQTLSAEKKESEKTRARKQWAASFSWQKNAAAYLEIYRRLANQS